MFGRRSQEANIDRKRPQARTEPGIVGEHLERDPRKRRPHLEESFREELPHLDFLHAPAHAAACGRQNDHKTHHYQYGNDRNRRPKRACSLERLVLQRKTGNHQNEERTGKYQHVKRGREHHQPRRRADQPRHEHKFDPEPMLFVGREHPGKTQQQRDAERGARKVRIVIGALGELEDLPAAVERHQRKHDAARPGHHRHRNRKRATGGFAERMANAHHHRHHGHRYAKRQKGRALDAPGEKRRGASLNAQLCSSRS